MDSANKKALFRAKLNASRKNTRIDSPLVRYNENDQPVCRVCNVTVKSESLWDAHQASRKHHEAINNLKASAARSQPQNLKPVSSSESTGPKYAHDVELDDTKLDSSKKLPEKLSSSVLPPNFFDDDKKKQKTEIGKPVGSDKKIGVSVETKWAPSSGNEMDGLVSSEDTKLRGSNQTTNGEGIQSKHVKSENMHVKGALPEGFFDDKEADLQARGIKIVKPDVKDEYKEFEKSIQEHLQEVDERMEDEEIDAAETIEEAETVEQRANMERVEMLKKRKMEMIVARAAKRSNTVSESASKKSSDEESSSDEDDEQNFSVDWRAQHL